MIELGLQRISRLLATTPLPWRAIHVAGTNGKGSVCAYISAMLAKYNESEYRKVFKQQQLKHARFTSPHLIDRWDCITIDQKPVTFELFRHIEESVHKRNQSENIQASEFELLTAAAFEIFAHEKVDVGVVEVGLGGRLDATNIIGQPLESGETQSMTRPPPLVTAITKIGLDHQGFLGDTLAEIAIEKAGIMKPGVPVVFDESNDESVKKALTSKAGDRLVLRSHFPDMGYHTFDSREQQRSAAGETNHRIENIDVAFRSAWTALQRLGRVPQSDVPPLKNIDLFNLAKEMASVPYETEFPGRLQSLDIHRFTGRKLPVLLDGAHNQQSAEVLGSEVYQRLRRKDLDTEEVLPVSWLLAASDTKDITPILKEILLPGDKIFAVEFGPVDGMPWVKAMSTETILEAARGLVGGSSTTFQSYGNDVAGAIRAASETAVEGPMVIAGSLYLVGDVLRVLRDG